jgi:hypothetical protein
MPNIIILLALITFCGCSTRQNSPNIFDPNDEEVMVYIKPKMNNYKTAWSDEGTYMPNWIFDPTMGGKYEAGIGSAKMDVPFTEYNASAYKYAINEICQSRKVKIKSLFKDYSTGDGVEYVDSTTKLETLGTIENARIVSTWIKTNTNEYFIWVIATK